MMHMTKTIRTATRGRLIHRELSFQLPPDQGVSCSIYVFLLPTERRSAVDNTALVKVIFTAAFIPAFLKYHKKLKCTGLKEIVVKNIPSSKDDFGTPTVAAEVESEPTPDRYSRAIFTFDGAFAQTNAVITGIYEVCMGLKIDLFKWAASCSGVQQPNDTGPLHRNFKKYFKNNAYKQSKQTYVCPAVEELCRVLVDAKMDSSSYHTYRKFLVHLPDALTKVFHRQNIRSGATRAGFFPFSPVAILSGCTKWMHARKHDSKEERSLCVNLIMDHLPALLDYATTTGHVPDHVIDENYDGVFGVDLDPDWVKTMDIPVNHYRCSWLSHPAFMEFWKDKYDKQAKKKTEEEERRKIRELAGTKPPVEYKCSNPACGESSTSTASWSRCSYSGCRIIFCNDERCQGIGIQHESVCAHRGKKKRSTTAQKKSSKRKRL